MNDKIDTTLSGLYSPGSLWINENTKQLRYRISNDDPSNWIVPLSVYEVGNDTTNETTFVKRGQPVSLGLYNELSPLVQQSADPAVVPTNAAIHQWSIGIALEPGNATRNIDNERVFNHVHILSHGQIEYRLDDTRDNVFQPPFIEDATSKRYLWTYDDIGKPIYVSNNPIDNNGAGGNGLTLDITHAYHDGARIISIGRLADAPKTGDPLDLQKIVIEVALAGDVRGMIDSTQFDVTIISENDYNALYNTDGTSPLPIINGTKDKLIFVKIKEIAGEPKGIIITSDAMLTEDSGQHSPIGAFVAHPDGNNQIDLSQFFDQTLLCNRLGILEGNKVYDNENPLPIRGGFQFDVSDFGKELFLSNGDITTLGSAGTYEYKVGLVLDENRILIDCRYPRIFKKFDPIGTILPAYTNFDPDNPPTTLEYIKELKAITTPGFIAVTNHIHKISGVWSQDELYPTIDFSNLLYYTMYNGIYQINDSSYDPSSPNWREIRSDDTFDSIKNGYFRFKDLFYNVDINGLVAKVITQIKYTQEGSEDEMSYLWPEMTFEYIWRMRYAGDENARISSFTAPNPTFDINYLASLGYISEGNNHNIEDYDINLKVVDKITGRLVQLAPGFFTVVRNNVTYYYGYQWVIYQNANGLWNLGMYTQPNNSIQKTECLGITWPLTEQNIEDITLIVSIRRRPIQNHNLMLNQLVNQFPWKPYTDGQNLVTKNAIHFGDLSSGNIGGETIYTVADDATEFRLEHPERVSGEGGYQYWKRYVENYGEYHSDLYGWHQLNYLEKYISPSNNKSMSINPLSGIVWGYDFANNVVTLSADMALAFRAKNTSKDVTVNNNTKKYIDFIGNYNDNRTLQNTSGEYRVLRSALKTLHEVPLGFFKYTDNEIDTIIGTAQQQWDESIDFTPEQYLNNTRIREIFPTFEGQYVNGSTYQYVDSKSNNNKLQGEWNHILEEIGIVFKDITRNSTGIITDGGNYQSFQSNIGLLNYAAKETQDRLLRLERSVFGIDAPTLPLGLQKIGNKIFDPYQACLDDGGLLRISKQLFDNLIIEKRENNNTPYFSIFKEIYYEIFGNYESQYEFDNLKYQFTEIGKFHNVYINFKDYIAMKRSIIDGYDLNNLYESQFSGLIDASRIYLSKSTFVSDDITERVFHWPINTSFISESDFNESRWWENNLLGVYDPDSIFASQSLEGLIRDIISKLSYLKENSDDYTRSFNSYFTFLLKKYAVDIKDEEDENSGNELRVRSKVYTPENYFFTDEMKFGDSNRLDHEISQTVNFNGHYTAFGFIDDKINSAWSMEINPKYLPNNWTNDTVNAEKYKFISSEASDIDTTLLKLRDRYRPDTDMEVYKESLPDQFIYFDEQTINSSPNYRIQENNVYQTFTVVGPADVYLNVSSPGFGWTYNSQTGNNNPPWGATVSGVASGYLIGKHGNQTISGLVSGLVTVENISYNWNTTAIKLASSFTKEIQLDYPVAIPRDNIQMEMEHPNIITKIRAKEHITDQIHLTLNSGPKKYAKSNYLNEFKSRAELDSYFFEEGFVVLWKPVNSVFGYQIDLLYYEGQRSSPAYSYTYESTPRVTKTIKSLLNCMILPSSLVGGSFDPTFRSIKLDIYLRGLETNKVENITSKLINNSSESNLNNIPHMLDYYQIIVDDSISSADFSRGRLVDSCDEQTGKLIIENSINMFQ